MRSIVLIFFYWSPTNDCINPTYKSINIFTPNISPVTVLQWVNTDWSQNTKTDMVDFYQRQYSKRLTFEDDATVKYNCHSWAWAGGTTYWMNTPEEKKYFSSTDQSYIPTTSTLIATKVWFGSADHSANTTSSSGYFSSKWGAAPRFTHAINDCPYSTASLTYFIRTPTITGPKDVCTSYCPQTFTVTNAPAGFTWDKSSNITLSGSGTSVTAYAPGGGYSGWISVNYNGTELVRHNLVISSSAPVFDYIDGPTEIEPGSLSHYYEAHFTYGPVPSYYEWEITGAPSSWYAPVANGYGSIWLCVFYPATYYIYVTGHNSCGNDTGQLTVEAYYEQKKSSYSFPNPASDILNIAISQEEVDRVKSVQQKGKDANFDIRLIDLFGVLKRSETTSEAGIVQLNVSGLQNGNYFLFISDGVSRRPVVEKIVVKH